MHPTIAHARALLERLDGVEDQFAMEAADRDPFAAGWQTPQGEAVKPEPQTDAEIMMQGREFALCAVETLGDEVGKTVGKLERRLNEAIKRLDGEIAQVRSEIECKLSN